MMKSMVWGVIVFLAGMTVAQAQSYTYRAPAFDTVTGRYTTNDAVSVAFSTASRLSASMASTDISGQVVSFTLSDGVQTLTENNARIVVFEVGTEPNGLPSEYRITVWRSPLASTVGERFDGIDLVYTPGPGGNLIAQGSVGLECLSVSSGVCTIAANPSESGSLVISDPPSQPGRWRDLTARIPVVGWPGMVVIVLGLLWIGRRRLPV